MKLLFVTPALPRTPGKGYMLKAFHQIRILAARHQVDLISFDDDGGTSDSLQVMQDSCRRLTTVPLRRWRFAANLLKACCSGQPLQVSYYNSGEMAQVVGEHLQRNHYDAAIFQLTRMAQYLPRWYRDTAVLDMVDPYILNYQRSLDNAAWYWRQPLRTELKRLRNYEPSQSLRFDKVLLLSKGDTRDYRQTLGCRSLDWVPHGVDLDYFSSTPSHLRKPRTIVITGNMNYRPNVEAVDYFCHKIFPLILKQRPDVKLWIVGSRPSASVQKWNRNKNIRVTGFVPDIRVYLGRAAVSVCPVRLAVGTQTKVLEAMAMGTPVVTTSAGNHGVGANSGQHLLIADEEHAFAQAVISLLEGKNWQQLSQSGRAFVADNFSWENSAARLERILTLLAQNNVNPKAALEL